MKYRDREAYKNKKKYAYGIPHPIVNRISWAGSKPVALHGR